MNVRPTRQEVLLGNRAVLSAPPSTREFEERVPAGAQGGLVRAGSVVHQLLLEDAVSLSPDSGKFTHTPLHHPETSPLYYAPAGTPDGGVVFVNQGANRLLEAKDGKIEVLVETERNITSAVTLTQDGALLYGTQDGVVHTLQPDGTAGAQFSCKAAPERVATGPDGTTFVGQFQELSAFGKDGGEPIWSKKLPTVRAGYRYPLLVTADGSRVIHTGLDRAAVAFDAKTGEEAWKVSLPTGEGDCFNEGILDRDGNLFTVSDMGILFKVSPEGKVLWKRDAGIAEGNEFALDSRVEVDADGNVCFRPHSERFQVYSPDGVLLLDMKGKDAFGGTPYLTDFTVSPDGRAALLMTYRVDEKANRILEVGLPGPAGPLIATLPDADAQSAEPDRTIREGLGAVQIGGIQLPVRS